MSLAAHGDIRLLQIPLESVAGEVKRSGRACKSAVIHSHPNERRKRATMIGMTMKEFTGEELREIRQQSIKAITPSLGDMTRANLVELLALEADEDNPRETLVEAITKQIEKIDADDAEPLADAESPAPEPPAYQSADYTGPLTIDQAQWRHANIKPVSGTITK